jgi:tRNA A-37 threonylcarbamoyl transferase component Bud32
MMIFLIFLGAAFCTCVDLNDSTRGLLNAFYDSLECIDRVNGCPLCASERGEVVSLEWMFVAGGGGSLSGAIGELRSLRRLVLRGTGIAGSLVSQLGRLTQLTSLVLSKNNLTGAIPTQLGQLTLLQELSLDANSLDGTLASQLGRLTALRMLTVNGNANLFGTLPAEILALPSLVAFSWITNTRLSIAGVTRPTTTNVTEFPPLPPPFPAIGVSWHATLQPLAEMRFSFFAERTQVHIMLETPSLSWVGIGFGARLAGMSMSGADLSMMVLMPSQGRVLVLDSFAVLDRARPMRDSMQGGSERDWFNVSGERVDGITRFRLSRARDTGDRWDNPIPALGKLETLFAIGNVPGFDDLALSSFHAAGRRAVQLIEWAVPPPPALPTDAIVGGVLGGALCLLLLAGLIACVIWRRRVAAQQPHDAALINSERLTPSSTMRETKLSSLPIRIEESDDGGFFSRPTELLQVDVVHSDALMFRNASTMNTHCVCLHLPAVVPQYVLNVEPLTFRVRPGEATTVRWRVKMLCTTVQRVDVLISVDDSTYAALPTVALESELSTALDFDEIAPGKRIGEGGAGVVFAGTWRTQHVAIKLLRQEEFSAQDVAELRAEARLLEQLLHQNIVSFRGVSVEPKRCCLVTELAPFGSLKSVIVGRSAIEFAYVRHVCSDTARGVQFLHRSGIIHRDIKPANVLIFSLSAQESVVAKLTDFGSARTRTAAAAAAAAMMVAADRTRSPIEGTPIYMAPQLFDRSARPSEQSDCYSLGATFYEAASLQEPFVEIAFAWDVAKAVAAGKRPLWPAATTAPPWFRALVDRMWAQDAAARPHLDVVLNVLSGDDEEESSSMFSVDTE